MERRLTELTSKKGNPVFIKGLRSRIDETKRLGLSEYVEPDETAPIPQQQSEDLAPDYLKKPPVASLTIDATKAPIEEETPAKEEQGTLEQAYQWAKEQITGNERRVESTEALPDYHNMPEMNPQSLSIGTGESEKGYNVTQGILNAGPDEESKILTSQFPGIKVRKDEKGNFIYKSSIDGKEYARKPGIRGSDAPQIAANLILDMLPGASQAKLGSGIALGIRGVIQAAIEANQTKQGGSFDALNIPLAVGGEALGIGTGKALGGVAKKLGSEEAQKYLMDMAGMRYLPPTAKQSLIPTLPQYEEKAIVPTMVKAVRSGGDEKARELIQQIQPGQEMLSASERQGILPMVHGGQLTEKSDVRAVYQGLRAYKSSDLEKFEDKNIPLIKEQFVQNLEKVGGSNDWGTLHLEVKNLMETKEKALKDVVNQRYNALKAAINPETLIEAPNFRKAIIEDFRGQRIGNLPKQAQDLYNSLDVGSTYGELDQLRKELGASFQHFPTGRFKDLAKTGLTKKLYGILAEDQKLMAEKMGVLPLYNAAQEAQILKSKMDDALVEVFGDRTKGFLLDPLKSTTKKLARGEIDPFINFIKAIPGETGKEKELKKQVVTSGLFSAFGKETDPINFNLIYQFGEGLDRNPAAKAALMSNLTDDAKTILKDYHTVAKNIFLSSRKLNLTGVSQTLEKQFADAENLASKIYSYATNSTIGGLLTRISMVFGGQMVGITSHAAQLGARGTSKDAIVLADRLVTSPAFLRAVVTGDMSEFAKQGIVKKFWHSIKTPSGQSGIEEFFRPSIQSYSRLNQLKEEK